jgi:hypothetical protein
VLVLLAGILGWRFYHNLEKEVLTRLAAHRWEVPSKVYAEPLLLYPGMDIVEASLINRLSHLDYRAVEMSACVCRLRMRLMKLGKEIIPGGRSNAAGPASARAEPDTSGSSADAGAAGGAGAGGG